ncbi:phytoene desaturase family protein [Sphingobium sp. TCM1]|uniref:phytoene desaturase family protein n=1 Tax=Sphingobium sp. TCM1 TaxID=453246 RepID=UPI0007F38382|nr:NAD(P)/FAD-dependent oxidoreductase [Sphingobium sp. TCM1]OAN56227.1 phytoene dehydrogenase [Sphingobium sp. TCM1]
MAQTYDYVIAGGGHNGLVAACYLAKAGLSVCVVERNDKIGGGVITHDNTTLPGFRHDTHSVAHTMLQANPLLVNDELGLKSKYGLEYLNPGKMTAAIFDDGTILEFHTGLEETCQSIARISERDAEAYYRFNQTVFKMLDMLVMGMFSVPPAVGMQAMMMDQTPEGRELMRLQAISSWDLINEWFTHPKIKIGLARYASEAMTNPFDNGTGFGFYIILPFMHKFGAGVPVGGSGALVDRLLMCLSDHGGVTQLGSTVSQIRMDGGKASGVILDSGEEILARKGVIANLHVKQVFPHMLPGQEMPAGFQNHVNTLKSASIQPFVMHLALNEEPKFKIGDSVDPFFWIERSHSDVEEFAQAFRDMEYGIPRRDFAAWVGQHKIDKTRVPEGKSALHIYAFAPYNLKNGGPAKWDEIGAEVAQGFLDDLREVTTNMGDENILATKFYTPLDLERGNISMINADIGHLGLYNFQLGGMRPVPGYAQYKMPVDGLYMSGACTHPGGGVTGASGRNVAQVIFDDLGIDFEKVIA